MGLTAGQVLKPAAQRNDKRTGKKLFRKKFHQKTSGKLKMDEILHAWNGHGRSACGENVWDGLSVVRTLRLTTKDKAVTCDKCKIALIQIQIHE